MPFHHWLDEELRMTSWGLDFCIWLRSCILPVILALCFSLRQQLRKQWYKVCIIISHEVLSYFLKSAQCKHTTQRVPVKRIYLLNSTVAYSAALTPCQKRLECFIRFLVSVKASPSYGHVFKYRIVRRVICDGTDIHELLRQALKNSLWAKIFGISKCSIGKK